jgi:hypothetical protein
MTGIDSTTINGGNNVLPPYASNTDPQSFLSTGTYNASQYGAAWTDPPGTVISCSGKLMGGGKYKKRTIKVRKHRGTRKRYTLNSKKMKFKKKGSRKSNDTINFGELKWGSFTKQFKAYNREGGNAKNLREFAKIVLNPNGNFAEKTKNRARFYLNVIDKK